ncbi:MAG: hypothetical protein HY040_14090 [Planctomycetes bacterium]|nr:hypothetical protein [Planctomycetota bacterium]
MLASAGYDTQIKLTDVKEPATPARTLKEHSDAVYGVAFSPDGKLLASCSADRALKVWDVATGKLLYTLGEATDWLYALAWSPEGKHLASGGVDRSIRVYQANGLGAKLVHSVFAHEGPVQKVLYSKDGKTLYSLGQDRVVKAWDADRMVERKVYERLPETGLTMAVREGDIAVGLYDGSVRIINATTGAFWTIEPQKKSNGVAGAEALRSPDGERRSAPRGFEDSAPATPHVHRALALQPLLSPDADKISPAFGQRGVPIRVIVEGKGLDKADGIVGEPAGTTGKILSATATKLEAEITFPANTPAGYVNVQMKNLAGTSKALPFLIDPFPLTKAIGGSQSPVTGQTITLPASVVGTLDRAGAAHFFRFGAKKGQRLGVQVLTKLVGSKLEPLLQLTDGRGGTLAESTDGLLGFTAPDAGTYAVGVRDRELRGGKEMHYRLHIGEIPVITSLFPLGGQRGAEVDVQARGVFLGSKNVHVKIPADAEVGSKIPVPMTSPLGKPLGPSEIVAGEFPDASDKTIAVPGTANGVLSASGQKDAWRFHAKKGGRLILEVHGRRLGSPIDSLIEVLDKNGKPVPRAMLRCQAKTIVVFRDHDSAGQNIRIEAWSELAINDLLYVNGDLMKIKELPTHPDADCLFFTSGGQRTGFLDTTPTNHTMNEPMYKVSVHPPGTTFPPNGYPVFTLVYRNDDGGPGFGRDSRLFFDPPADGEYQVRISDARGMGGENFAYRLTVRPPRPSFRVKFSPTNPIVSRGGAVSIGVEAERIDGYDGPISIECVDLPPGFHAPTTSIEPGETLTAFALYAEDDAKTPSRKTPLQLVARAEIAGKTHEQDLEGETPRLVDPGEIVAFTEESEVAVKPGGQVKLTVHIERRHGFLGRVPLEVRGLPHGVRVLDIGLNGILVNENEVRRTFVIYAEPWVQPTSRPFVVLAKREGKNTEHAAKSVLLKVAP